ncbi:hypothetical protein OTU49_004590, partial [Cherax quadricarinatus]
CVVLSVVKQLGGRKKRPLGPPPTYRDSWAYDYHTSRVLGEHHPSFYNQESEPVILSIPRLYSPSSSPSTTTTTTTTTASSSATLPATHTTTTSGARYHPPISVTSGQRVPAHFYLRFMR